jgi:hypothetical protein
MSLDANVLSLGDFFAKYNRLIVPNYQRSYKWEQDFVGDLFQDINEGLKLRTSEKNTSCFLGSIVLSHDTKTGITDLVDGQQRLTTLSVLVRCLANRCGNTKTADKAKLLLGMPNQPAILHKALSNNICDDRAAFRECALSDIPNLLSHGNNTSRANITNNKLWKKALEAHLIYKARTTLLDSVETLAKQRGVSEHIFAEEALARTLSGIKLVVINTDERREGMRVFASINASGTKLEPWELVMSSFYSHALNDTDTKATEDFFESGNSSIAMALADNDPAVADAAKNDLLRSHWIAFNGYISKDDIFDAYNDMLSANPGAHADNITKLKKSLRCFRAFNEHTYKHPVKGALNFDFLHPLSLLGAKLSRPALIATSSLFEDPEELRDAMQQVSFLFEKIHMRWKIADKRTNTIDRPLAQIAQLISSGKLGTTAEELVKNIQSKFNSLASTQPTRKELLAGFLARDMTREMRLSKVIAQRVNNAMEHPGKSDRALDYNYTPDVSRGYSCDKGIKLMINQYQDGVEKYGFKDREQFAELIYSLGNTFLSNSARIDSRAAMNGGYAISSLTAKDLAVRRDELADIATDIWHF